MSPERGIESMVQLHNHVSRTRCGILHAAPQSRDRTEHRALYGPGSAAHRFARATRCAASGERDLLLERPRDGRLRVALYLPQMRLAAETLRVDFIDILGARGPRGK